MRKKAFLGMDSEQRDKAWQEFIRKAIKIYRYVRANPVYPETLKLLTQSPTERIAEDITLNSPYP